MVVASFTQMGKEYDVTMNREQAIDCTCPDRWYRKQHNPAHICKHMSNAQVQVEMEIERTATFLALQKQYDVRAIAERKAQEERETRQSYSRMFYYGI